MKKRKTHQYLFLSKYAFYHKKLIDIGVLGIHKKALLASGWTKGEKSPIVMNGDMICWRRMKINLLCFT